MLEDLGYEVLSAIRFVHVCWPDRIAITEVQSLRESSEPDKIRLETKVRVKAPAAAAVLRPSTVGGGGEQPPTKPAKLQLMRVSAAVSRAQQLYSLHTSKTTITGKSGQML